MKFSLFAIVALTIMSSRCMFSAAAPKSKKSAKKVGSSSHGVSVYGATGPSASPIPIGGDCTETEDGCEIPLGLTEGVCRCTHFKHQLGRRALSDTCTCQSGKPDALCGQASDCLPLAGSNPPHAACRNDYCTLF